METLNLKDMAGREWQITFSATAYGLWIKIAQEAACMNAIFPFETVEMFSRAMHEYRDAAHPIKSS